MRAVRSPWARESRHDTDEIVTLVESNTRVPSRQLRIVLAYWAAYPDEIDTWISDAERAEADAAAAWNQQR